MIWEEMRQLQREMDRLMPSFWEPTQRLLPGTGKEVSLWSPATADVKETDTEVIAQFDIPGIDKKDIELNVDENGISVKAERKAEVKQEKKCFIRHERSYTGFYRHFQLPAKVIPDKATADYKDGVLKVVMPKAEPKIERKGKRLEIR